MKRRLLVSYVSLTALVLVLLEVPLGLVLANSERRRLEADVQHDAFALALRSEEELESAVGPSELAGLQQLADRYARDQGGRVIFVNRDGTLVADSTPPNLPGGIERSGRDFTSRVEIARGLRGKESTGERYSQTLGRDLLYVAVPIASGGVLHGVVRITYPLSFVNDRIRGTWLALAGVGGVVLLAVFFVSVVLARSVSKPLADLEVAAEALGRGRLDTRVAVPARPHEFQMLARSFNGTAARLEQLVDAQAAFVADASHQLRTPLAALRLRIENLAREAGTAGADDASAAIDELSRLSALVDGLLDLARAEAHGSAPSVIEVRQLMQARCDVWGPLADERGVTLALDAADARVLATPGRIDQVLDNLLNNSLDVAPSGTVITITARHVHDQIEIRVGDAGPGMSDEDRARAFDRFWRSGPDSSGFGLGLAIVRQLVVADGGDVSLGTSPAGGLEVTLRFPAA